MAWTDKIREAAYNSPTGARVTFSYEDVSVSIDKKTSAHTFPDANGTYVQDMGHTGRQFPIRAFLWGKDYDSQAADLEAALIERGIGKLEHPVYGTVDVVPFGTITRRDDLKTAANQAVIEVTFWESINLIYPSAQTDPASQVAATIEGFNLSVRIPGLDKAIAAATFAATFATLLNKAAATLGAIANAVDNVGKQFKDIVAGLLAPILDPLVLAAQTLRMLQAPARSRAAGRQDSYERLMVDSMRDVTPETFPARELFAMGCVTGTVISLINTQYATKVQALEAADRLLGQFGQLVAWRDDNAITVDTGESYQKLQEAVSLTAGYLVEISFSLKAERRITLDRPRTIIDLSAEIYGSVDDKLDFLISSNALTGDEILELQGGHEIVFYI